MTSDHVPKFKIDIRKENFDINLEMKYLTDANLKVGAVASFVGKVRDLSKNSKLKFMEIEHYPEMSEKVLRDLCKKATLRWELQGISLIHRIGKLYPGENIVLLVIASVHRAEAFDASLFLMDFLKSEAPFWKKETTITGSIWVEENQVDKQKLLRWQ